MSNVAHVLQDVGCNGEVKERRNRGGESLQFYRFSRGPIHYCRTSLTIALILLSNLRGSNDRYLALRLESDTRTLRTTSLTRATVHGFGIESSKPYLRKSDRTGASE